MNKEIEIKFLNINKNGLRELLRQKWYICHKEEFMMLRKTFHNKNSSRNEWFRLRVIWEETTLTYKCIHNHSSEWIEEIETVVLDFENTAEILLKTWLTNSNLEKVKNRSLYWYLAQYKALCWNRSSFFWRIISYCWGTLI